MNIVHGGLQNSPRSQVFDDYPMEGTPATIIYNNAGVNMQQYCDTMESRYLDLLRLSAGMCANGSMCISQAIQNGEFI